MKVEFDNRGRIRLPEEVKHRIAFHVALSWREIWKFLWCVALFVVCVAVSLLVIRLGLDHI